MYANFRTSAAALLSLMLSSPGLAQDIYVLETLFQLNQIGGAKDLNESGAVCGLGHLGSGGQYGAGWRWINGQVDLAGVPFDSAIEGINNQGRCAGWVHSPGHATLFFPSGGLPDVGWGISGGIDVADNGIVAGWGGFNDGSGNTSPLAWVPNQGGSYGNGIPLQTLAGLTHGLPLGLNEQGTIVGYVYAAGFAQFRAVRWDWLGASNFAPPTDLETLDAPNSIAYDIGEDGTIVGSVSISSTVSHACRWTPNGLDDLGIGDGVGAWATGIAQNGAIVGNVKYVDDTYWPCAWRDGVTQPLKGRIAGASAYQSVDGSAINSAGWICGTAIKANGSRYAVLLRPICPADIDGSGIIDGSDLGMLLSNWGGFGTGDIDGNGVVDGGDLGLLVAGWGACEA